MFLKAQLKESWSNSSKKLKYTLLILILFSFYCVLILVLLPKRYYRSGYYLPGLSGWEFGIILILLYIFITIILLEPPISRDKLKEQSNIIKFNYKSLVILNIFIFIAMYLLLFATQMLENLISVYKCQSRTGEPCNKDTSGWMLLYNTFGAMGLEHNDILYFIWTFSGVLFIGCFIFFGIAVDYAKRKGIFEPEGMNAFNYIFWVNVLLGSTGWMYMAWFSLTDFDMKMWTALANGETWGYFSLGVVGVFFNSIPELIFMISSSCSFMVLNFYTLKKYLNTLKEAIQLDRRK